MEHLERARLPATRHRAPCAPQPAAAQPERTPARSSAVLAAPQLTTLAAWGGLQAPGSGLRAPGSRLHYVRYVSCRRHHPVLLGRAPQALGSWPCHALRTSRSATEGPVGGCGATWAPDNVADFVAFHPQVLGFVYNSTLSLRLRRKRNTSILVTV